MWHSVWNKRDVKFDSSNESILSKLIKADGFDSPTGMISESSWLEHSDKMRKLLKIVAKSSLYEVGMGAGAFLYPYYNFVNKIGGIDYSASLINVAKRVMPKGDFILGDALYIDINTKYDLVVSNSVFFYFTSYEYAMKVLNKMFEKATNTIAILEVSDIEYIKKAEEIRQKSLTAVEYQTKYKDFQHLYYSKEFFMKFAEMKDCNIKIFNPNITGYNANKYRFSVIINKNKKFNG